MWSRLQSHRLEPAALGSVRHLSEEGRSVDTPYICQDEENMRHRASSVDNPDLVAEMHIQMRQIALQ